VRQDLLGNNGNERDASGNIRFKDIGAFLKEISSNISRIAIRSISTDRTKYMIVIPANSTDAIFCYYLRSSVHAAMPEKPIDGWLLERTFTHVPLEVVIKDQKRIILTVSFGGRCCFPQVNRAICIHLNNLVFTK
jgi:6-phosphofructokinase 1